MIRTKNILWIAFLLTLASCQSSYRGRMIRVKKQNKQTAEYTAQTTNQPDNIEGISQWNESLPDKWAEHVDAKTQQTLAKIEWIDRVEAKHVSKIQEDNNTTHHLSQPQDSIAKTTVPDEEFIKEQYRKANRLSVIALILFLLSPFLIVSIIASLVLAILAVRIYRKYKNPGVRERYGMAMTVLALSALLILLSLGLIAYALWVFTL